MLQRFYSLIYRWVKPKVDSSLTFGELMNFNEARRGHSYVDEDDEDWNFLEWGGAVAGEAGEFSNRCKKIRRDHKSLMKALMENPECERSLSDSQNRSMLYEIAFEMADIIHYLQLSSVNFGIDLDYFVAVKYNEVSRRLGSHLHMKVPPPQTLLARYYQNEVVEPRDQRGNHAN